MCSLCELKSIQFITDNTRDLGGGGGNEENSVRYENGVGNEEGDAQEWWGRGGSSGNGWEETEREGVALMVAMAGREKTRVWVQSG